MMFSVIIATCNRPDRFNVCLEAVRNAAEKTDSGVRLIIADNGDRIPCAEVVSLFRERSGLDVKYLRSEPRNKSRALNTAIGHAVSDWLAFTDDDCLPDDNWLVNAWKCVETSGWRAFGGRVQPGPADNLPAWLKAGRSGRVPEGGVFVNYDPLSASGLLEGTTAVPFGANFFIRKDIVKEYGGYDERLWDVCGKAALGVEDAELGLRLRNRGEPLGYCREALVVHPVNVERYGILSHLRFSYYYGWRDPLVFFQSDRPLFEWFRLKAIALSGIRSALDACSGDFAGMVQCWTNIARHCGSINCRWSEAYRRHAGYPGVKK